MPISAPVKTQWSDDGIHMTILETVSYTDAAGRIWSVPAGFVTDGASIPQEFWDVIGSPFTGKYRVAAVFHDAAYATLGVAKDDADIMLRDASIELGCPVWLAEAIYLGVCKGGLGSYADDQAAAALALQKASR